MFIDIFLFVADISKIFLALQVDKQDFKETGICLLVALTRYIIYTVKPVRICHQYNTKKQDMEQELSMRKCAPSFPLL